MKKKLILFMLIPFVVINSSAQSNFMFGPSYTFGVSSIYGTKMPGMDMSSTSVMTEFGMKFNLGVGLTAEYFFNQKFGIVIQSGFMQRGAKFDIGMADYGPRYRFSYIDVMAGAKYRTAEIIGKSKLFFSLGGSQHTLVNAYRVNSYNAVNIKKDIQMIDFGAFVGMGIDIPSFSNNVLQVQLFANSGFKSVFGGVLEMNGMQGKNILYGLGINYLLGSKKKEYDTQ